VPTTQLYCFSAKVAKGSEYIHGHGYVSIKVYLYKNGQQVGFSL
jgi:hypothetical protein